LKIKFDRSRSPKKEEDDDKKDIKLETKLKDEKGNVKIKGTAPKMATGKKRAASEDILVARVEVNRSQDMKYWENDASANEIRNQILQRTGGNRRDLEVKSRKWLLAQIRKMIRAGTW
jgi:hypothetical protein